MFGLFRKKAEICPPISHVMQEVLSWEAASRKLALFRADMLGLQECLGQFSTGSPFEIARTDRRLVRDMIENHSLPYLILDPRPGLHIVDVNEAFASTTSIQRRRIAGGKLFDLFPENPDRPDADGVSNVYEFFRKTAQDRKPRSVASQRYDIRDVSGRFIERKWHLHSVPICDDRGRLTYLLFHPRELCS